MDRLDLASFVSLKQNTIKIKNNSVWNTITFYLEDDNNEKVYFNGETLTFTLRKVEI